MSELIKWFEKRRETKALSTIQRHLALTTGIVEDLEKALQAAINDDEKEVKRCVKRVDMVADWTRESTRVLHALSMKEVPNSIKEGLMEMIRSIKECAASLQRCVNKMMSKPEEALQAADTVEREEEKVDDLHEKARMLLVKEDLKKIGVAIMISQLFEAMEMIADSCEDACDQVRVIMVRK